MHLEGVTRRELMADSFCMAKINDSEISIMTRLCSLTIAAGITLFILTASLFARPTLINLALFVSLLLAISVMQVCFLFAGILSWRHKTVYWFLPTVICVLMIGSALCLGSPVGRYFSDRMFQKNSAEYAEVITKFRSGDLHCVTSCNGDVGVIMTSNLPSNIRQVFGTHCDTGGILVLFSDNTDVPLLHEGYLYKDYPIVGNCSKRYGATEIVWSHVPFVRSIENHWYRFADQPGF